MDTEWRFCLGIANLSANLSKERGDDTRSPQGIKLPIDIAPSRLAIVNSGRASEVRGQSKNFDELLQRLNGYEKIVVAVIDQPRPL